MSHPNPSTALARVVMDELVVHGVRRVVISPGSRSAALAIAAVESDDVETVVVLDERSAAFRALGATKAGQRAAVVSTSGTASANFFPAIVEADMACEPLVVITADRPAEMQGVGANQTIDQVGLYGAKVRGSVQLPAPEPGVDSNSPWREELHQVLAGGGAPKPGPVHINVAFREPTVPVADDGRTASQAYEFATPRIDHVRPAGQDAMATATLGDGPGVIVAGDGQYDRAALAARADELGWPVLATAMSSMRGAAGIVSTYHHLLRRVPEQLVPSQVVAVGSVGPSVVLERFISSVEHQVRVDRWGRVNDPNRTASQVVSGDVVEILQSAKPAPRRWLESWIETDTEMRSRLVAGLVAGGVSCGAVAHSLNAVQMGAMVVGSSLPIREIDAHLTAPVHVFGNRGASGIDGFVSSALGVADAMPRTVALAGDLSLLHDSNGFLADRLSDLVIVVLDNGGGGLFDSLPQARHAPSYERLFVTPHDRDFADLARLHHVRYVDLGANAAVADVVNDALSQGGVWLVRVEIDRHHDLAVREGLGY